MSIEQATAKDVRTGKISVNDQVVVIVVVVEMVVVGLIQLAFLYVRLLSPEFVGSCRYADDGTGLNGN